MKKAEVSYEDFLKLQFIIGEVIHASNVEKSNKLIELEVNLGEVYGKVSVFTGMQKFYTPQDFMGKKFIFLANLTPRPMMGRESQGMLLAADIPYDEGSKPILLPVEGTIPTGTIVR